MRLSPPAATLLSLLLAPAAVRAGKEVGAPDDRVETCAGEEVAKNVLYNYVELEDPPTPPLLLSRIVGDGASGSCGIASWGLGKVVSYDPTPGFTGEDTCTYEACLDLDKDGEISAEEASRRCVEATLLITVKDCATAATPKDPTAAPVAPAPAPRPVPAAGADDAATTCRDRVVSTNVVYNDAPPGEAPLLVAGIAKGGDPGACIVAAWGFGQVVTYGPPPGFIGDDACDYEACEDLDGDGAISAEESVGRCVEATLRIVVEDCATNARTKAPSSAPTEAPTKKSVDEPVGEPSAGPTCNDVIVTAHDDAYTTPKNTPVLLEPLDNDGVGVPGAAGRNAEDLVVADPLLFAGRHGTCTFYEASAGAATPDLSTTLLWYTPSEDFHGEDRCVYKACDSAAHCDVASIVITVLPSPGDPVARDDVVETPKDTPVVVYPLANDDTPEGHALSVTAIAGGGEAEHGECVVTSDETVLYVPEPGYAGLDECQYRACDNQGKCDEATIKIKVVGEADEPCDDKNSAEPTPAPQGSGISWNTQAPTMSPITKAPTSRPVTPSPTICGERRFYYTESGGCSNDDGIKSNADTFATREQCCIVNYPNPAEECIVKDICEPAKDPTSLPTRDPTPKPIPLSTPEPTPLPTPPPTICSERKFYYTVSRGCVNDDNIEPGAYAFETREQCCIVNYPSPTEECIVKDICEPVKDPTPLPTRNPTPKPTPLPTPEPSPLPTPSPTICSERKFYYTASRGCVNDDNIAPGAYAFETREQCCIVNYPSPTEECIVKDICEPVKDPTPLPTRDPTSKPTPLPTPEPSPLPTTSPTRCGDRRFYYTMSGGCANDDNAEPDKYLFETREQCCIVNYPDPTEECSVKDICEPAKDPMPTRKPTPKPTLEPTPNPTPEPTPLPTTSPVTRNPVPPPTATITQEPTTSPTKSLDQPSKQPITAGLTLCEERMWCHHPSLGCTNKAQENDGSNGITLDGKVSFFKQPGTPTYSPTGNIPTYSPTGLTNDNSDGIIEEAECFESLQQCCIAKYADLDDCISMDTCTTVENLTAQPTTGKPTSSLSEKPTPLPSTSPTRQPTISPSKPTKAILVDTPKPTFNSDDLGTNQPTGVETIIINEDTPTIPAATDTPTWGGTPTVGTDTTSAPVKQRGSKLRNML